MFYVGRDTMRLPLSSREGLSFGCNELDEVNSHWNPFFVLIPVNL